VQHLYGLTETFGPIVVNDWHSAWSNRTAQEVAVLKARQGVGNVIASRVRVLDPDGEDVAADGESVGEIAVRGNDVMLGYYRDNEATEAAMCGDWLLTGDLAVCHPDGYLEITDRRKDVIISGGENIASVEVERALEQHPAVAECAVVGIPDERWGEVPVAHVVLRSGRDASPDELIAFLRLRLAGFKVPRTYVFGEIPKTSTGKVQKHALRARTRMTTPTR